MRCVRSLSILCCFISFSLCLFNILYISFCLSLPASISSRYLRSSVISEKLIMLNTIKKFVFDTVCVHLSSRLRSITQLMCNNIYLHRSIEGRKNIFSSETSQIIPFVTVLSGDFEFVSQNLPWSHSCHHYSLVAQFCFRNKKINK